MVVVQSGNGTEAVATPGTPLVEHQEAAQEGQGLGHPDLAHGQDRKKKAGRPQRRAMASGTTTINPPPVAVTLETLPPSAEPALCPPTGTTKCEGNIIQAVGNFSPYTNRAHPIVAVLKFFYGAKVPAGSVYFLRSNGKTVDKLAVCTKTSTDRYNTPCLAVPEKVLGTTGNKYAQDTVYFTGADPGMGRR